MNLWRQGGALFAMLLLTAAARAASLDIKPGLWETTHTVESSGTPPLDTGRLTPEQKARIEAMVRKREAEGPRTRTFKECLTKEKLEHEPFSGPEDEAQTCVSSVTTHTPRRLQGKRVCTLGQNKKEVAFDIDALSPEQVKGSIRTSLSDPRHTMTSHATFTSRWLGSDCGNQK